MGSSDDGEASTFERIRPDGSPVWLPDLPPISGDLCVRVLLACGWLPVGWTEQTCALEHEGTQILVPRHSPLDPDLLADLLYTGRIVPLAFIMALERICAQELATITTARRRLAR
jgi:hypothetical protein